MANTCNSANVYTMRVSPKWRKHVCTINYHVEQLHVIMMCTYYVTGICLAYVRVSFELTETGTYMESTSMLNSWWWDVCTYRLTVVRTLMFTVYGEARGCDRTMGKQDDRQARGEVSKMRRGEQDDGREVCDRWVSGVTAGTTGLCHHTVQL